MWELKCRLNLFGFTLGSLYGHVKRVEIDYWATETNTLIYVPKVNESLMGVECDEGV